MLEGSPADHAWVARVDVVVASVVRDDIPADELRVLKEHRMRMHVEVELNDCLRRHSARSKGGSAVGKHGE